MDTLHLHPMNSTPELFENWLRTVAKAKIIPAEGGYFAYSNRPFWENGRLILDRSRHYDRGSEGDEGFWPVSFLEFEIIPLSSDRIRLVIYVDPDQDSMNYLGDILLALKRDWPEAIPIKQEEEEPLKPRKNRAGRPRDPINDWAWEQVNISMRKPDAVYQEWCQKLGGKIDDLMNPRDSFSKAISPKRGKRK